MHLLVVEDDPRLGPFLRGLLARDRHVVDLVETGQSALDLALDADRFLDGVVLDVGLPDMSGLEVARRMRREGCRAPILMLTARDALQDRVAGLDAGADDYLVKPFAYEELAARLRALERRAAGRPASGARLRAGAIELDEVERWVRVEGRTVDLSPREFALLESFMRHPGQVLSRDQLMDHAWPGGIAITPNTVDTYVHYVRDKLSSESGRIETVRGVGYRLADR
jgi:two-component system, OmpR family, response regulator